jgi:hypothetical protein
MKNEKLNKLIFFINNFLSFRFYIFRFFFIKCDTCQHSIGVDMAH